MALTDGTATKRVRRIFSQNDLGVFAALSGDHNPLHTDPLAARRLLFGSTVCHGIRLVLGAIDLVAQRVDGPFRLARLNVVFRRPVAVDQPVTMNVTDFAAGAATLEASTDKGTCATIALEWVSTMGDADAVPSPSAEPGTCRERSFAEASQAEGSIDLCVDPILLAQVAPTAALRVYFPSTVFLDEPVPSSVEYAAAEAAGEAVTLPLAMDLGIVPIGRRLPPLATDQTCLLPRRPGRHRDGLGAGLISEVGRST